MKKIYSLLISICLCAVLFCGTGLGLAVTAAKNLQNVNAIDLVRLKKYLSGVEIDIGDADYNEDGDIDVLDLVALRRIFLGLPVNPETEESGSKYDDEGFNNWVYMPQLLGDDFK